MLINFDSIYRIDEGYGSAGENILLALDKLHDIDIYTNKNWEHTDYTGLQDRTIELCERGFSQHADFGIRFSQPDSFNDTPEADIKIGWCLWEHNNLPPRWINGLHELPINFVSCAHNKELLDSVGARNVFVVNLGVNTEIYSKQYREYNDIFTFVISGTLNSRKNPDLVYSVFRELFENNKDVNLIIKSTEQNTVTLNETHNIQIINQVWPAIDMAKLLRTADCFVLPTQGEGFGLCALEAMAVGTTVICTNWSGPADYLDDKYAYKLGYNIKKHKIKGFEGLYEYADPDRGHLKELMWHIYTHRDEAREKGALAARWTASHMTWKHTANRIIEILHQFNYGR